jgi:hypothetical protein
VQSQMATAEVYDPVARTFTPVGNMTKGRSGHTATLLPDGRVLIAGGDAAIPWVGKGAPITSPIPGSAELYDAATQTFAATASMVTGRTSHNAILLPNRKVLIAGGIARSVRRRQEIEKRLYQRIDRYDDTSAWGGVAAAGRITRGWQQSLMGKGIRYCGNCRGCLYFPKPLIVGKEERVITLQWPSDTSTELIADEWRDRTGAQIELALSVE